MRCSVNTFLLALLAHPLVSCAHKSTDRSDPSKKPLSQNTPAEQISVRPNNANNLQQAIPGDPIFWMVGGWNSCKEKAPDMRPSPWGMNAYQNFLPMFERLKATRFPKSEYFASCLTPDIRDVKLVSSSTGGEILDIPRESAISLVAKRASELNAPIIIIGHSYGGWISMKAAQTKTETPVKLLLTMDPISAVTCTQDVMAQILEMKILDDLFAAPPGCTSSPQDITEVERNLIRSNIGRWVNIWQIDTFNLLHGSPISQAENEQITQDGLAAVNGHIALGLNPLVWQKIQGYIETTFIPK